MAKADASRKIAAKKDAAPRKEERTLDKLRGEVDEVRLVLGQIDKLLNDMQRQKLDAIQVDGIQKFPRATKLLRQYKAAIATGIERELAERG